MYDLKLREVKKRNGMERIGKEWKRKEIRSIQNKTTKGKERKIFKESLVCPLSSVV